jgi:hypothetical protein
VTPIYLSPAGYPRWCRLRELGEVTHVTACGARIAAGEPVLLAAAPPMDERCGACDVEMGKPGDVAAWERWRETTAPGARR